MRIGISVYVETDERDIHGHAEVIVEHTSTATIKAERGNLQNILMERYDIAAEQVRDCVEPMVARAAVREKYTE